MPGVIDKLKEVECIYKGECKFAEMCYHAKKHKFIQSCTETNTPFCKIGIKQRINKHGTCTYLGKD